MVDMKTRRYGRYENKSVW